MNASVARFPGVSIESADIKRSDSAVWEGYAADRLANRAAERISLRKTPRDAMKLKNIWSKLDFGGGLIWVEFDFHALDAVFSDIKTFPFGS